MCHASRLIVFAFVRLCLSPLSPSISFFLPSNNIISLSYSLIIRLELQKLLADAQALSTERLLAAQRESEAQNERLREQLAAAQASIAALKAQADAQARVVLCVVCILTVFRVWFSPPIRLGVWDHAC